MDVFHEDGTPAGPNEEGLLVVKNPWPAMVRKL